MSGVHPGTSEVFARFDGVLRFSSARGVSDIHVKAGQRPVYRRHGELISRKDEPAFSDADLDAIAASLLPARLAARYAQDGDATFALGLVGGGRFRVSITRQRASASFAVRVLPARVASMRELNVAKQIAPWALFRNGLVLVAGAPGAGRTATWLALLEHVNTAAPGPRHVVTLEDPIEVVLDDKIAFIRQRELDVDLADVRTALRELRRHDVDVIGVDELPADALVEALDVAEGSLVIAVVPGEGPIEALRLLLERTDPARRELVRQRLALRLRGVTSQVLVPTADGKSRLPAMQVLVPTPQVAEHLAANGDLDGLRILMDQGRPHGMQTLDHALFELVQSGQVAVDAAVQHALWPDQLRGRLGSMRSSPQLPPDLF